MYYNILNLNSILYEKINNFWDYHYNIDFRLNLMLLFLDYHYNIDFRLNLMLLFLHYHYNINFRYNQLIT